MIISIVGLSGSGKSFISNTLKEYNAKIVHLDIDKIGHSVYEDKTVRDNLVEAFGPSVVNGDLVNRKELGRITFASPEAMKQLEDITWHHMEETIDIFIKNNQDKIILLDWLLLPKTKYFQQSDLRILIKASREIRMQRAMSRDNITEEEFLRRDNAAPAIDENNFEYIINNEEATKTKEEVRLIYDKSIIHR